MRKTRMKSASLGATRSSARKDDAGQAKTCGRVHMPPSSVMRASENENTPVEFWEVKLREPPVRTVEDIPDWVLSGG
jgi:uncharacterized OB-fold protein